MRIELLYAPGCNTYAKARNTLETLIAEERLPISVECVEEVGQQHDDPILRVDGGDHHRFETQGSETLRDLLIRTWKELTEHPLARVHS
jgi:hypothetical protein